MTVRINTRSEPTRRSLEWLRQRGYVADICERKQGKISRDLFGAFDIVGFKPGSCILVQTTSDNGGNFSARCMKVRACPELPDLVAAGVEIEVHGWKPGKTDPRVKWLWRDA